MVLAMAAMVAVAEGISIGSRPRAASERDGRQRGVIVALHLVVAAVVEI